MTAWTARRSRRPARPLAALAPAALLALLAAAAPAFADEAPADSVLDAWMRARADSTAEYFGLSAQPPDSAGLDSALDHGLAQPPGGGESFGGRRRRLALSFAPRFAFNRAVGAAYGGSAELGLGHRAGGLRGALQWANGPDDWYGTGGYAISRGSEGVESRWSFAVDAGRRFEPLNRDYFNPFFTFVDAFLYGTDRHSYLRRDGVRTSLRVSAPGRWIEAGYRNELESPLVTTATWTLLKRSLVVEANAPAAFGRASELRLAGGAQVPGTPLEASLAAWNAGGALGGDHAYHRYRAALGGGLGLGRRVALTPQFEYARLTGAALPQDVLYLGGSYSLITVDPQSRAGTGRAVAHAEVMMLDGLQKVLGIAPETAFPIQLGAFATTAARWGYDPATGAPRATARDWPGAEQWQSEAGVSLLFRPGVPEPDSYLRVDYAWPVGPNDREAGFYLSWKRTLFLLGRK